MQRGRCALALSLVILGSQAVWADLTVRYQLDFNLGPTFPAGAADTVKQQIAGMVLQGITTRVEEGKCASSFGLLSSIVDIGKGEVTLLDPATKTFATVPQATYLDRVVAAQPAPAASQQAIQTALTTMKIEAQSKKTGAIAMIQGIRAEETLITVTMEAPSPAGPPISFRLEMHQWLAAAEELARVPALNDIGNCSSGLGASADPGAMIERIVGPFAGASGLGDAMKDLATVKGKITLKIQMAVFAPEIVAMLQVLGPGGPAGDINAPLIDVSFNLAELSPDPIPDAMFQVPEGYRAVPLEDLLKTLTKPGAVPAIEDFKGPIYQIGEVASIPTPVYQPEPTYTEEARRAGIQGVVTVSLVVDESGAPRNVKVLHSLDPGLDQEAVNTVRRWKFTPGQKDGRPVAIAAQVQVSFRLLDKPPQQ